MTATSLLGVFFALLAAAATLSWTSVLSSKFVAVFTVRAFGIQRAHALAAQDIFFSSDGLKMVRVYAFPVSAKVVEIKPFGYLPLLRQVNRSVRADGFFSHVMHDAVALIIDRPPPLPAAWAVSDPVLDVLSKVGRRSPLYLCRRIDQLSALAADLLHGFARACSAHARAVSIKASIFRRVKMALAAVSAHV